MLDIKLKGENSYAVADALAARDVPFVFATGNSVRDIGDVYQNRPVLRTLSKAEKLVEALTAVLAYR